jgi:hypothetical protein
MPGGLPGLFGGDRIMPMNRAYTHYSDLVGTAAGDFHPEQRFNGLAEAADVDLDQYFPVAVKILGTPPKIVSIYAIEKRGAQTADVDALCEFVRNNPQEVRLREFGLPDGAEIAGHFKEFAAILHIKDLDLSAVEI